MKRTSNRKKTLPRKHKLLLFPIIRRRLQRPLHFYNLLCLLPSVINNLVHRPLPNSVQQVSRMANLAAQILEQISFKETKKKMQSPVFRRLLHPLFIEHDLAGTENTL